MLTLLALLFTKHFVFDFVYQPPYQWQNKGTYGHWGGLVHTGQHVLATFFILLFFTSLPVTLVICAIEFLIHYHMDWFKMNLNKKKGWGATTHNEFWVLTGFDQYVHAMTYILIGYLITVL